MKSIVVLNDQDNVATSLMALENGQTVVVSVGEETRELTIRSDVPFGHKIAIRSLDSGDDVLKYGEVIGRASRNIELGDWVHIHNVESARARGDLS